MPGAMAEDDLDAVVIPVDNTAYLPATLENGDSQASTDLAEQAKAEEAEEEAANAKPQLRVKSKTPQRAKPSKTTLLQFAKKKRKRSNSEGSDIDMDATPPPSPTEEECGIEKRRSGRNTGTKRKKYVDDVQMTFTEEELKRMKDDSGAASAAMLEDILGPIKPTDAEAAENSLPADGDLVSSTQAGPNYAFIDPTAEDTMIVQYILTARTGTRELEESEVSSTTPSNQPCKLTKVDWATYIRPPTIQFVLYILSFTQN